MKNLVITCLLLLAFLFISKPSKADIFPKHRKSSFHCCPVNAHAGKRAKCRNTHIRKKLVQQKVEHHYTEATPAYRSTPSGGGSTATESSTENTSTDNASQRASEGPKQDNETPVNKPVEQSEPQHVESDTARSQPQRIHSEQPSNAVPASRTGTNIPQTDLNNNNNNNNNHAPQQQRATNPAPQRVSNPAPRSVNPPAVNPRPTNVNVNTNVNVDLILINNIHN